MEVYRMTGKETITQLQRVCARTLVSVAAGGMAWQIVVGEARELGEGLPRTRAVRTHAHTYLYIITCVSELGIGEEL